MLKLLFLLLLFFAVAAYAGTEDSTEVIIANLTESALANYPLNDVIKSRLELARENVNQAELSWFNNVNLSYQYTPGISGSGDNASLPLFGVGLSVNLGNVLSTPSRIRQANAALTLADADLKNHLNYIKAEVRRRYANYKRSINLLIIRSRAVEDSESSMLLAKKSFEAGELSLELYNQTLRSYTDNLERKAVAEGDVAYHKASLEELTGRKL